MFRKKQFVIIFPTFERLGVVKRTLPSVIEEVKRNDGAQLIVHDSSVNNRSEKWEYLRHLNRENDFFLILSSNLSMAHARNLCLHLAQEMYAPDYICMVEDDHGFNEGLIPAMVEAMKSYYGKKSPNGLRYGMFTACYKHTHARLEKFSDKYAYPSTENMPFIIGGFNSCFRCAPTSHWDNVLKGYDTDEYPISTFQTANLNWRNYHKGFTVLFVGNGDLVFDVEEEGRGMTSSNRLKLWDDKYCASDPRSKFLGKRSRVNKFLESIRRR